MVLKLFPSFFANSVWETSFSTRTSFILFSFIFQTFISYNNANVVLLFHQTARFMLYLVIMRVFL